MSLALLALGTLWFPPQGHERALDEEARTILLQRCVECHGPEKQKGHLRLDQADSAARTLVPGRPDESDLLLRVTTEDPADRMPLDGQALPEGEVEILRRWILDGARWPTAAPRHWAYEPPRSAPPPPVRAADWVRSPIDAFVLARLEREGLEPQAEADRRTLARRLALDLTGLPPDPVDVRAFVADERADAYERYVERQLASPHFGERWALPWLDLARYADTNGYEKDERRTHWPWRDWVIDAFNADMPFDRFTLEQIAGDLLPGAGLRQRLATGFQRNTLVNQEGGTDPEEFRYAAVVDRVNTLGSVWLGTTLACAQCHNHKYDPFSQRDYFRLFAYFDSTRDTGNRVEPVLAVPDEAQENELGRLRAEAAAAERQLAEGDADFSAGLETWAARERARLEVDPGWSVLRPLRASAESGATLSPRADGSLLASGANPDADLYEIDCAPPAGRLALLRLEALPDPSLPGGSSGRAANGNFVLDHFKAFRLDSHGQATPLALVAARADAEQAGLRARADLVLDEDDESFWAAGADRERGAHELHLALAEPIELGADERLRVRIAMGRPHPGHNLGCLRLSANADVAAAQRLRPAFDPASGWEIAGPLAGRRPADEALTWRPAPPLPRGAVRPLAATQSTWVLRRRFALAEAQRLRCYLGADDDLRARLDGRVFFEREGWDPVPADAHVAEIELAAGEHVLELEVFNGGGPGALFFDATRADLLPPWVEAELRRPPVPATESLRVWYRREVDPRGQALVAELARLVARRTALEKELPSALVLEELARPRDTRLHAKGAFLQPDEPVQPGTPHLLPATDPAWPTNRLGLALWLIDPRNPLVARVQANRLWEQLFGRGLVATGEDFGTRGATPSHPELLDWLALELVRGGWSVKALLRTIVGSATYRQSSVADARRLALDPEAALLSRSPRPRLAAEWLRDQALAIGGLLAPRLGGPSVFPPQPEGVWAPVYSDDRWVESQGPDRLRRGLYTFWKRSAPYAAFMLFDAPSREACCPKRAQSDTPMQALALLNDAAFLECARALGERMRLAPGDDRARIAVGFERCTARAPEPGELDLLAQLLETQGEPGGWSLLASVLLNLDETLCRP